MHVTAVLAQGAGAIKYILPATDTSCVVTHRIMLAQLLFNDVSVVLPWMWMGKVGENLVRQRSLNAYWYRVTELERT